MSLLTYVYVYILGGITVIPLSVALFIYLHPIAAEEKATAPIKAGEVEETSQSGLEAYKSGWLIVTQHYLELDSISSTTQSINDSQEAKSAYSSLYKLVQKDINGKCTDVEEDEEYTEKSGEKPKSSHKKHRFYAVLKHGNLFLYRDESMKDVRHVIVLSGQFITMWPRTLTDGQLFVKNSAIAIVDGARMQKEEKREEEDEDLEQKNESGFVPRGTFFVYCDVNSVKEDWYFSLIRASKQKSANIPPYLDPSVFAKTLHFTTDNMMELIATLYSSEGQLQSKWFNALIGRLFLAFKDTKVLEDYLYAKVSKKLNKIKKPGFLDEFTIKSIYAGDSAPFLTYPKLKEISPGGTVLVSTHLTYRGNFSIQIATKVNINLGFKPREVDILLNITLKKMEGPLLIKFKPPPSNRFWYTFETEPVMNIKIEPIISSRQMAYNIITYSIEKKFKDAVRESLVLPHWDDSVFYDTSNELYRGGIWERKKETDEEPAQNDNTEKEDQLQEQQEQQKIEVNIELTDESPIAKTSSRQKLTTTFSDLSKRVKGMRDDARENRELKEKNANRDQNSMFRDKSPSSFGSSSMSSSSSKNTTLNTIKKIGKWYFKEKGQEEYSPPEMISSRRTPRKASLPDFQKAFLEKNTPPEPTYDFGKVDAANDYKEANDPGRKQSISQARPLSQSSSGGRPHSLSSATLQSPKLSASGGSRPSSMSNQGASTRNLSWSQSNSNIPNDVESLTSLGPSAAHSPRSEISNDTDLQFSMDLSMAISPQVSETHEISPSTSNIPTIPNPSPVSTDVNASVAPDTVLLDSHVVTPPDKMKRKPPPENYTEEVNKI